MNDQKQVSKNLRKSAQQTKRIHYKVFNQTGIFQEVEQLTNANEGVDDVTVKSKEEHFIDINMSTLNKTDNQDIDIQEISNLLNNFNIISSTLTMGKQNFKQNNQHQHMTSLTS